MKHAILGAGAIGGLVGAVLAHEGEDVRLLVRPEKQSGYSGKLKLNTPKGAMESPVRIETKLIDDVDVLWVAAKMSPTGFGIAVLLVNFKLKRTSETFSFLANRTYVTKSAYCG